MMLSICIPTYNCNVNDLVAELSRQCAEAKVDFEIIVLEDGSDEDYAKQNSSIEKISGAKHIVDTQNHGRSYTRNKLADIAKGEKLIFIDCDSAIPDHIYINRYIENSSADVVCGGTTYNELQYSPEISLRYTFGTKVEKTTADKRNQAPYSAFTTNNMMVSKKVFEIIRFCEALKKYGHEDSLFGFELQENKIPIFHIDNPVIHTGIESNDKFLAKTRAGIENLVLMRNFDGISPFFFNHIRLYRHYAKLKKSCLLWTIRLTYKIFGKAIEKHLLNSKRPKLMLFNLYKLGYLCEMEKSR
ncbi:MAG: glycosyltransferase family 2 protein [Bacteroidales bacterium]|nr:glycosyltransferase family 2 protein [Bacteroidales bacterium]